MVDEDRDIGSAVLAFRGDRKSAAAGAIFTELDRRERISMAEAERRAAQARWADIVENQRLLDGIADDVEKELVMNDDDQRGQDNAIFAPGEAEKLGDVIDQRDIDRVLNAEAKKRDKIDDELDKLDGLMESDIEEFHRIGGSDRRLALLRGED